MIGVLGSEDLFEKNVDFDLRSKFQTGDIFKAKVKKIEVEAFKVMLTKRPQDLRVTEKNVK